MIGWPPYTGTTRTPSSRPYRWTASATCMASSRVGASTSDVGRLPRPSRGTPRPSAGRAGLAGRVEAAREALEHRQRERRGLAGAGGRLGEQVAAREQGRDRRVLDGRGLLVAEGGERAQETLVEAEGGEARGGHDGRDDAEMGVGVGYKRLGHGQSVSPI